jgi:hypothetical protein
VLNGQSGAKVVNHPRGYAITFDEAGAGAMPHRGTLEGLVRAKGVRALSSELGGTGGVTTASLGVARQG